MITRLINRIDYLALRRRQGLSQIQFWSKVGVTQSGGSRFENGRRAPHAVEMLLDLVYIRGIELEKINRDDLIVAGHVAKHYPDLYRSLLKDMHSKNHGPRTRT